MSSSSLPPEITHEILLHIANDFRASDIRKALRLHYVSRLWDRTVVGALFAGADQLDSVVDIYQAWPAFLAYRAAWGGPQDGLPRPVLVLRRVAERLVAHRSGTEQQEEHDAVRNCIFDICATMKPSKVFNRDHIKRHRNKPISDDDEQLVQTLLAVAASTNDIPLVRKLLSEIRHRPYLVAPDGEDSRTQPLFEDPLSSAALAGDDEIVRLFLDFKQLTSAHSAVAVARRIALPAACRGNHLSTVELVLQSKPQKHDPTEWNTVLYDALFEVTDVETFKRLYEAGRTFLHTENLPRGHSPGFWVNTSLPHLMYCAAERGAVPLMDHLMGIGATAGSSVDGNTLNEITVGAAASKGQTEAVVWLLQKGFPIGRSLDAAVRYGNPGTVEALLEHIGETSMWEEQNIDVCLEEALERGNEAVARLLLNFGSLTLTDEAKARIQRILEARGLQFMV
ncbi:hypothetical protein PG993_008873 [Apiospora rasikravindrae]|uniref:Uncharacterized protein n=1 Tax=Apiospora rasikravindrae TaxID=990691 RepID=A0ABR1SRC2_9PEZI